MPIKVTDDQGVEIEAFTAEDVAAKEAEIKSQYEAQLADKDKHLKEKTDEFLKGKSAQELKEIERDNAIAEANQKAEEARSLAAGSETKRMDALKAIARKQYTGDNPELISKFDESWNLINMDIKEDTDISKRAELAANMSGLNSTGGSFGSVGISMGGGIAPQVSPANQAKSKEDHDKFKNYLGLNDFIPKTDENK